jgi:predicted dehydrogenase
MLALKSDILAGRFGQPVRLKAAILWPRRRSYYQRSHWAGKIRTADGAWVLDSPLNNATAHYLHNMLFLLGESTAASALPEFLEGELYRANPIENYDTAAVRANLPGGAELLFLTAHPVDQQCGPLLRYEFEHATIEYPGEDGALRAIFKGGRGHSYGSPDVENGSKLWQTVEAVRSGVPLTCDLRTALPQLICAAAIQQAPIHAFPQDSVKTQGDEEDPLTFVRGLYSSLLECYTADRLPSDPPAASWAGGKTAVPLERSLLG